MSKKVEINQQVVANYYGVNAYILLVVFWLLFHYFGLMLGCHMDAKMRLAYQIQTERVPIGFARGNIWLRLINLKQLMNDRIKSSFRSTT